MRRFYESARSAGRYDFECGRSLVEVVKQVRLLVLSEGVLPDDELSFSGAARDDILAAWQMRLERMVARKH